MRDKAVSGASDLIQDTLTKTLSEEYLTKLLESAEAKKVLQTIFTPAYINELLESSDIQGASKLQIEALLTKDYLNKILESSEAKKVLKETLNPEYVKELLDNTNIKGLAKEQMKTLLKDPEFQRETKQSIQKTLSLLIQDALPPLFQLSAGLATITLGQRHEDENVKALTTGVGGYHFATGAHQLLGIKQSQTSKMALGATSLLASQFLLSDAYQMPANMLGVLSLGSGFIDRYGAHVKAGQWHADLGQLTKMDTLKKLPGVQRLTAWGETIFPQWGTPKISLEDAASQGNLEVVKKWIELKADLNQGNAEGQSPLLIAAAKGHSEIVTLLINTPKVELTHSDKEGQNALHHAALNGQSAIVKMLIDTKKIDLRHRDQNGQTALHHAAAKGHGPIAEAIVNAEKGSLAVRDQDGLFPLHHATLNDHVEVANALSHAHPKTINAKALLEADAKKAHQTFRDAAKNGQLADVYEFIQAGADLNSARLDGKSALYQAAENNHPAVVKALIHAGANINQPSLFGWTPLFHATLRNNTTVVQALVDAGADLNKTTLDGLTPLAYAEANDNRKIAKILKKADAKDAQKTA